MLALTTHHSLSEEKNGLSVWQTLFRRKANQSNLKRRDYVCRDQGKLVVMLTLKLSATRSTQNMQFRVTEGATRKLKEENLNRLCDNLPQGKAIATKKVYVVALPTVEAHSGHEVGKQCGFAQRIYPELIHQINEVVLRGV